MVVQFGEMNRAYDVQESQYDAFDEWVENKWQDANNPKQSDELSIDYLGRIGVIVWQA